MKKTIQLLTILLATFFASSLFATGLAELQINIGKGTEQKIGTQIRQKVVDAVKSSPKWKLHRALGGQLGKAKNCFTIDCLRLAGKNTGYAAGLRVRFSGEAQIYDWSIEIYDLNKGNLISSQKGACELCGKSEVLRTFERSLTSALQKAKVTKTTVVKKTTETRPEKKAVATEKVKIVKQKKIIKQEKAIKNGTEESLPDIDSIGEKTIEKIAKGEKTRVVIDTFPTDALILLNEKEIGKGSITLELDPGKYNFQFRREGYSGLNETIVVSEVSSSLLQFKIHLSKTDPDAVYLQNNGGFVDDIDRSLWGWVGIGTGGALLITGIYLSRLDGTATCSTGAFEQCPEIYNTGTGATITTTAGAALLTAGAGLLLWDILAGENTERRTAVVPSYGGKGVALTHSF